MIQIDIKMPKRCAECPFLLKDSSDMIVFGYRCMLSGQITHDSSKKMSLCKLKEADHEAERKS